MDSGINCRRFKNTKNFPNFEKPKPIGFFSIDRNRDYTPDTSQLSYFHPPPSSAFPLDLNVGLSAAIKKPESAHDECLDSLLKFINDNFAKLRCGVSPAAPFLGAEFICWRGLLRLIMCTPYEYRENWSIYVTRYKGSLYMCKRDTESDKYARSNETELQKKMAAWGFQFEKYCLSPSPYAAPNVTDPVNECEEFSMVFRTKLNGMNLMYGAEMDGLISMSPLILNPNMNFDNLEFVELKVSAGNRTERQQQTFLRFKTRNWWCQSFLVGIKDLYVGWRDNDGMVHKMEKIEVRSLPKLGNFWAANDCGHFLSYFLHSIKAILNTLDCPYTTYEFTFNSGKPRITYNIFKGKTAYSFLPDWYIEAVERIAKNETGSNVDL